jgi:hypothetical protein
MFNNVKKYGPKFAIDNIVVSEAANIYRSVKEVLPWFQLEFVKAMDVRLVSITMRKVRGSNVGIYVGNQPAVIGANVTNPVCAISKSYSIDQFKNVENITCKEPLVGRYLQVQLMRFTKDQFLQINEIEVSS